MHLSLCLISEAGLENAVHMIATHQSNENSSRLVMKLVPITLSSAKLNRWSSYVSFLDCSLLTQTEGLKLGSVLEIFQPLVPTLSSPYQDF